VTVPGTDLEIWIDPAGYIFGHEGIELIDFIPDKHYPKAVDLGCGDGILAVLLAQNRRVDEIWAVDLDIDSCRRTAATIELNHLSGRVQVRQKDIRKLQQLFKRSTFDLVISNPPFFKSNQDYSGSSESESQSRREILGDLRTFIQMAKFLINRGGQFVMIYHPSRMDELFCELKSAGLTPKVLKVLYHLDGRAIFIMVRAVSGGKQGLHIEPPAFLPPAFKKRMLSDQ